MRKIHTLLIALIAALTLLNLPVSILAAKPRIINKSAKTNGVSSSGFVTVRLSRPANSVIISLRNLGQIQKVDYTLSYAARGIEQGVVGGLTPTKATDSRSLYFGTCSKGVCTPHRQITGAVLTIKFSKKSGGILTKRYRIKV